LRHSIEKRNGPKSGEVLGSKPNNLAVRLGTTVAALSALAVLGGTPNRAEADIPTCDVDTIDTALTPAALAALDAIDIPMWISENDTDGVNTYTCTGIDTDGDWVANEYKCWDGTSWLDMDFSGTSMDRETDFMASRIVDGSLFVGNGSALQLDGSGLSWNTETNLRTSLGIHGYEFTYDPYTDDYYYRETDPRTGEAAIFQNSDDTYALISDLTGTYSYLDPASCGDGNLYVTVTDYSSLYQLYAYDIDSGDFEPIAEIPRSVYATCSTDGTTTTLYYTEPSSDWSSGTPYQITCTHGGGTTYTYYLDADLDSYGDSSATAETGPSVPTGYSENNTDCDDADASVNPRATESCNGTDDDCDGDTDEDVLNTYYLDSDNDGHGDPSSPVEDCAAPSGYVSEGDDCDNADPTTYPDAPELCDGIDNDCSDLPASDEVDNDGDSHMVCEGDCDDSTAITYPGASELCDGLDNDCDDTADDGVEYIDWHLDADSDGYGDDSAVPLSDCNDLSPTYSQIAGDCDDGNSDVNPDADEIYDGFDNDCDGGTDLDDPDNPPDIISTEGDCSFSSKTSRTGGSALQIHTSGLEKCIVTYDLAEDGDGAEKPFSILYEGSGAGFEFVEGDGDDYYVVTLDDHSLSETETHHSPTDIFEGTEYWIFGASGSKRFTELDGYALTMNVMTPTITLLHDIDGGYVERADIILKETFTQEGDRVVVDLQNNTYEVNPQTDTGDTNTPDDTAEKPDTGTKPPDDNCEGCSASKFDSPEGARAATWIAALLALAGLRRRKDKKTA